MFSLWFVCWRPQLRTAVIHSVHTAAVKILEGNGTLSVKCQARSGQIIYSVTVARQHGRPPLTSLRVARVLWSIADCLVSSLLSLSRPLTLSAVSLKPSTSFTRERISLSRLAMQTLLLSKLASWISA